MHNSASSGPQSLIAPGDEGRSTLDDALFSIWAEVLEEMDSGDLARLDRALRDTEPVAETPDDGTPL